jgi:hypothetical protein
VYIIRNLYYDEPDFFKKQNHAFTSLDTTLSNPSLVLNFVSAWSDPARVHHASKQTGLRSRRLKKLLDNHVVSV